MYSQYTKQTKVEPLWESKGVAQMNSFKIMELGQPSHFIGEKTKTQRLNGLSIQTGKFQIKLKLSLKKKKFFLKVE